MIGAGQSVGLNLFQNDNTSESSKNANLGLFSRIGSDNNGAQTNSLPSAFQQSTKVAFNNNASPNSLLKIAINYLSKIDANLRLQIGNQKAIFQAQQRADRESRLEQRKKDGSVQGTSPLRGNQSNSSPGLSLGAVGIAAAIPLLNWAKQLLDKNPNIVKGIDAVTSGGIAQGFGAGKILNTQNKTRMASYGEGANKREFSKGEVKFLEKKGYTPRGTGFVNQEGKFVKDSELLKTLKGFKGELGAFAKSAAKGNLLIGTALESIDYIFGGKKLNTRNIINSAGGIIGGTIGSIGGAIAGSLAGPVGTFAGGVVGGYAGDRIGRNIAGYFTGGSSAAPVSKPGAMNNVSPGPSPSALNASKPGVTKQTKGMKAGLQKSVYQAFRNAGYSHEGALALSAEVGRENGYRQNLIFGTHIDPSNKATNVGMFSWQGNRGKKLYAYLNSKGLIGKDGKMIQSQKTLDAQAAFVAAELQGPYRATNLDSYLRGENVDSEVAARKLGKNYIKWRIDDPKYAPQGNANRRSYYRQVAAAVGSTISAGISEVGEVASAGAAVAKKAGGAVVRGVENAATNISNSFTSVPYQSHFAKNRNIGLPGETSAFSSSYWQNLRTNTNLNRISSLQYRERNEIRGKEIQAESNVGSPLQLGRSSSNGRTVPSPSAKIDPTEYQVYFSTVSSS